MIVAARPTVTPDDLLQMGDAGKGYELVDGELVEVAMSTESSHVGNAAAAAFRQYARQQSPGYTFGEGAGFQCFADDPGRVRKPDAAYVPRDRLTPEQYASTGWCPAVPSVVVEVVSPNDLAYEVERKIEDWLAAGVELMWVVNPPTRSVRVIQSDGTHRLVRETGELTGNGVLPGFALPLAELFWTPAGG